MQMKESPIGQARPKSTTADSLLLSGQITGGQISLVLEIIGCITDKEWENGRERKRFIFLSVK